MSTKDYANMLEQIVNKICNSNLNHKNSIIVGDNSSGKSDILKSLVSLSFEKYYFIDTINRTFDGSKIFDKGSTYKGKCESITEYRLQENIFNLQDSFDIYGDGTGHVEFIFFDYIDKLKVLIKKFLDIELSVKEVKYGVFSSEEKIVINDEIEKLSNGYQAIIRMFLEIMYVYDNKGEDNITIVIDEIDEYLSSKNKSKIIPFLQKEFPNSKWIFTTHSADTIASTKNFNLILLKGNNYECLDSNDFSTITDVQEIFRNLYDNKIDNSTNDINTTLRRLLSLKISEKWSEQEEKYLAEIEGKDLTNSQLLLLHQIKTW